MEKLIPIINKLQDVFNTVGRESIQLPQITVIGTQSAGKSSVLENIVGKDFLPRGSGIVTRRPLILQLVHVSEADTNGRWGWGCFLHKGEEKFEDFAEIRDEIAGETDRLAGNNKGISDTPIRLTIYSPNVLNLTLIDLPGITRVPVGDQPQDIEVQIRTMIVEYIKNPKSIILAVHPANTDIATSESLKLAKEVDPEGRRTLAVCTKLDLMDQGTDAKDLLCGKIIPVKLGIIGVVNRSQKDIVENKPIAASLKDEQMFLLKRYPAIASSNGTTFLAKSLNKLLMQHIRDTLPVLRHDIATKLGVYESQLQSLGEPVYDNGPVLLQILTKFALAYCQKIEGTSRDIETHQLAGGARICYIFHNTFSEALNSIKPLEGLSRTDVLHAISNSMGPRPALAVSEIAFELLVKRQIQLLRQPSLQCVELVYEELQRIQYSLSHSKEFQRFPILREHLNNVVMKLIRERLPVTNRMVEDLIAIEGAYINTNHPDFVGGTRAAYEAHMMLQMQQKSWERSQARAASSTAIAPAPSSSSGNLDKPGGGGSNQKGWLSNYFNRNQDSSSTLESAASSNKADDDWGLNVLSGEVSAPPTSDLPMEGMPAPPIMIPNRQQFDCELIEKLVRSYFLIVRKSVQDSVPKAVMHCLVNHVKEEIQSQLVGELYRSEEFSSLMDESPEMKARRVEVAAMVVALRKASDILNEIRDLQFETQVVGYLEVEY